MSDETMWTVTWSIDLPAESAEDAARKALEIQRDPESIATVFAVAPYDEPSNAEEVDLLEVAECSRCGALYGENGHDREPCEGTDAPLTADEARTMFAAKDEARAMGETP